MNTCANGRRMSREQFKAGASVKSSKPEETARKDINMINATLQGKATVSHFELFWSRLRCLALGIESTLGNGLIRDWHRELHTDSCNGLETQQTISSSESML